jgi:hypothetical protein
MYSCIRPSICIPQYSYTEFTQNIKIPLIRISTAALRVLAKITIVMTYPSYNFTYPLSLDLIFPITTDELLIITIGAIVLTLYSCMNSKNDPNLTQA